MTKYTLFIDPGHGWLKVQFEELVRLGIENDVSQWSYRNGDNVYLEEDCDAKFFLDAKKAKSEAFTIAERLTTSRMSKIRSYDSYDV